ncbi:MAG: LPS-assembly protein LptD [Pseudomonadota bacterium]
MRSVGPRTGAWVLCLLGGCYPAAAGAADAAGETGLAEHFWTEREALPPVQAARVPEYCGGGYVEPEARYPLDVDTATLPIRARASEAAYRLEGDMALFGEVHLEQGNRTVEAAEARLQREAGVATAVGSVRLLEPGLAMQGESATVNLDTEAAAMDDVEFLLFDSALRGEAGHLAQDALGNMSMSRGAFTRCEPGNDSWRVRASSVEVEAGDVFATARNAVLEVYDVPVLYTPYIRFPVSDDRQSGWLFPTLGYSGEDGVELSLPYYLNLAPNYDATLMPRYVGERGAGMEGEFRHLSAWHETVVSGAFLYQDDLYDGELERDVFEEQQRAGQVAGEFQPEDRWLYALDHSGGFGNFGTRIDYTAVSDRDYFHDLGTDLQVSSQIELERRGELRYDTRRLSMRLWAQRFQRLDERDVEAYQRLPELDLSYVGDLPGPLEWSMGASAVSFTRDNDDLSGLAAAVGDRYHLEPRLRLPVRAPWGFLTLSGGYRYTAYDLRDVPADVDPDPERGIALGSAHTGLVFERELDWFDADLVQTLEPELFYLYQDYEDQAELPRFDASRLTFSYGQLFRSNRFSGVDRIGDANRLSVGVTTRFVDAAGGREYLRASLGEIVYFDDRRVTLGGPAGEQEQQSTSAVAGELSGRLADDWRITGTGIWDPHQDRWDELGGRLQYRRDNRHILNVGFRKRLENDIEQTDVSLYWPVGRHLAVMGRWNYDVDSGRTIEGFGGIEYNDCCWQIRLMARRFLDSPSGRVVDPDTVDADEGIFVQIMFKGLAGFGGKIDSVMERGIRGYRRESTVDGY